MTEKIKVIYTTTYWRCSDGCCDNWTTQGEFMYNDKIHTVEGQEPDDCLQKFIRDILGFEFEAEHHDYIAR